MVVVHPVTCQVAVCITLWMCMFVVALATMIFQRMVYPLLLLHVWVHVSNMSEGGASLVVAMHSYVDGSRRALRFLLLGGTFLAVQCYTRFVGPDVGVMFDPFDQQLHRRQPCGRGLVTLVGQHRPNEWWKPECDVGCQEVQVLVDGHPVEAGWFTVPQVLN